MKSILKPLLMTMLIAGAVTFTTHAQKVKLLEGNLDALKGITQLNLEMDYSQMRVGKFDNEQEYLDKKVAEYDKKEPGRGDNFVRAWRADRKNLFEPQFIELFEKNTGISLGDLPKARYTLIFKTRYTEPGYNIYVSRKNAEIDGEAWIVETANPQTVVARIAVENCPGRTFGGYDYESGVRIRECYAVAGKGLGKFLKKWL